MSLYDLNDAAEQRTEGVIADGTFVALRLTLRPGGANIPGCSEHDAGLFKQSLTSDVLYIDGELTVIGGPHAGRKIFQNFTIAGGKVGAGGASRAWGITKAAFRAMVDSALALDPKDMSESTKAKRALRSFRDLDGIEFFAKLGIEYGGPAPDGATFPDRNRIAHIIVPGEPQYAALKAGKEVPPAPSSRPAAATTAAPAPVQVKPAWQQEAPAAPKAAAAAPQGPAWLRGEKS
jgi:hypothetical protein